MLLTSHVCKTLVSFFAPVGTDCENGSKSRKKSRFSMAYSLRFGFSHATRLLLYFAESGPWQANKMI
jgi:hypothetical protein